MISFIVTSRYINICPQISLDRDIFDEIIFFDFVLNSTLNHKSYCYW